MKFSHRIVVLFAVSALLFCVAGCKSSQPKTNSYTGLMSGRGNVPPAYAEVGPIQRKGTALPTPPEIGGVGSPDVAGPTEAPVEIDEVAIDVVDVAESPVIGGAEAEEVSPVATAPASGFRQLPPVPETPAIPAGEIYTVKGGDSLSKIAVAYGVKTTDIMALNPSITSADKIKVGQKITLPAGAKLKAGAVKASGSKGGSSKKIAKESIPADGKYSVRSGDCLDTISKRFGVKIDDIRRWSNLSSDNLQIGQELMLKGTAAAAPVEPVATAPVVDEVVVGVDAAAVVVDGVDAVTQPVVAESVVAEPAPQGNVFEVGISAGDTLDSLAVFYDTTKEAILKANPQIQSDADLKPGMKINIFLNQQ